MVTLGLLLPWSPSPSLEKEAAAKFVAVTPPVQASIDKALMWLSKRQTRDGFFINGIGNRVGYGYDVHVTDVHVGVTAIAGMAFLANGHVPGLGPYGAHVQKCVDAIVSKAGPNGFIADHGSRMYAHTFATLFLAEVYGMTRQKDLRQVLDNSIKLLVNHQNEDGGWRYSPEAADSDLSVVVCVVQALRAANNAGIHVPKATIDRALKYIRGLVVVDPNARLNVLNRDDLPPVAREGGFHYQNEERVTFAITAAGVTALHGTGIYSGAELDNGLKFLERRYADRLHLSSRNGSVRRLPAVEGYATNKNRGRLTQQGRFLRPNVQGFQYFYGHYYAAQAFHQAGGRRWERWFTMLRRDFMDIQFPDGHWEDEVGADYATAMAALILAMPKGYLPIFQR